MKQPAGKGEVMRALDAVSKSLVGFLSRSEPTDSMWEAS